MTFKELCEERYSVRKYTPEPVDANDVEYILECVQLAPSAVNFQPWRFVVVRSDEAKTKLRGCYDREWFATAPLYVIAMKNVRENWCRASDGKAHGDIDVAIAVEHLCLAAAERGLGTCWVCNFNVEEVKRHFGLPDCEPVALVPIGHIAQASQHPQKTRKPLNDIISEV
ncbi:MAG: nitroreductase family protein [Muribaculaceae bacterium]